MKINRKELMEALAIVKPGLASKEIIEQTTSFAFKNGKVVTYNDEISISHPIPNLKLHGAVKAEELYQLLNKIKKEEIDMEISEGEVIISSGRAKATFTLKEEITMPLDEVTEITEWHLIPEGFLEHVKSACGATSNDMSQPKLTCVNIRKDGIIEASDGYRIYRGTLEETLPVSVLLPATIASDMLRMFPVEIAQSDGWVHFQTEKGSVMSCRVFEDKFVDLDALLDVKGIELKFPKTINDVLEKAAVFSKRDYWMDEQVHVDLFDNKVKIHSKSDCGSFEEVLNMKYAGEPVQFAITPILLKNIITQTQMAVISDNKIRFEGEDWEYIAILIAK